MPTVDAGSRGYGGALRRDDRQESVRSRDGDIVLGSRDRRLSPFASRGRDSHVCRAQTEIKWLPSDLHTQRAVPDRAEIVRGNPVNVRQDALRQ